MVFVEFVLVRSRCFAFVVHRFALVVECFALVVGYFALVVEYFALVVECFALVVECFALAVDWFVALVVLALFAWYLDPIFAVQSASVAVLELVLLSLPIPF